jgi:hypothetical protein
MHRPKHFDDSFSRGGGGLGRDVEREEEERLFANLLRQRQGGVFSGGCQHSGSEGMGAHRPPLSSPYSIPPLMGSFPRRGFPPPMGLPPGLGMGIPGAVPYMGMSPDMELEMGLGRTPHGHSPFEHHSASERQSSPFGYEGPGPPRAHSFLPQHHQRHPLFYRPRSSSVPPRTMFDDEDDGRGEDCRMPSGRGFSRQLRGGYRFASRHPCRRRWTRRSFIEDSEDDRDHYDDYEDKFGIDDDFEELFFRRPPHPT